MVQLTKYAVRILGSRAGEQQTNWSEDHYTYPGETPEQMTERVARQADGRFPIDAPHRVTIETRL